MGVVSIIYYLFMSAMTLRTGYRIVVYLHSIIQL